MNGAKSTNKPAKQFHFACPALSKLQWFVVVLYAFGLGCANVFGSALEDNDGAFAHGKLAMLALFVRALLTAAVYLVPLCYIWAFAINVAPWRSSLSKFQRDRVPRQLFLARWALLVLCWLPYWFFLWPGITTADTWNQINQIMGFYAYNTHHPLAHTLILGFLFKIALAITHNATISISIVALLQLITLAAVVSLSCHLVFQLPSPKSWRSIVVGFFALNPIFGWFSVVLLKDVWLATVTLLLASSAVLILWRYRLKVPVGRMLWLCFIVSSVFLPLMKKTGVYMVVPALIVFILLSVGYRRAALLASVLALSIGIAANVALAAAVNASPGSARELFSLPSQQISRVVRDHPEILSSYDKLLLQRYYPDADLGELHRRRYNQGVADAAKAALDVDALKQSRLEYFELLGSLCSKAPGSCLTATAKSTLGYWYPGPVDYRLLVSEDWAKTYGYQSGRGLPIDKTEVIARLGGGVDIVPEKVHVLRSQVADFATNGLSRVPVVSWLLLPGAWSWLVGAFGCVAIARRRWLALLPLTLGLASIALCLVSPVYAEVRYALPTLFILPVLIAVTFTSSALSSGHSRNEASAGNQGSGTGRFGGEEIEARLL